jgi:hypothetical protein
MYKEIQAKVHKEAPAGTYLLVLVPKESLTDQFRKYTDSDILHGEIRIDDGRTISAKQRKKCWAILRDISLWNGDDRDTNNWWLKQEFTEDEFSLADCSVTIARHYISFLADFCLKWDVPTSKPLIDNIDDINAYLYSSLMRRKCAVCNQNGILHHAEDRVGMGRNRLEIVHQGMRVMCLCGIHHNEAHEIGQQTFNKKWKIYGIKADEAICEKWGLNTK